MKIVNFCHMIKEALETAIPIGSPRAHTVVPIIQAGSNASRLRVQMQDGSTFLIQIQKV
jgi:hypothetical protein